MCPAGKTVATQCPIGRPERWPARVCDGTDLQVKVAPGQQQSREEVSSAGKVTLNLGYLYTCNLTWWRGGGREGEKMEGREEGEKETGKEGGREGEKERGREGGRTRGRREEGRKGGRKGLEVLEVQGGHACLALGQQQQ